jgi:hypothetical protein
MDSAQKQIKLLYHRHRRLDRFTLFLVFLPVGAILFPCFFHVFISRSTIFGVSYRCIHMMQVTHCVKRLKELTE